MAVPFHLYGGSAITEYMYTAAVVPMPVIVIPQFCIDYYTKMLAGWSFLLR
jgi:hypothetical protein